MASGSPVSKVGRSNNRPRIYSNREEEVFRESVSRLLISRVAPDSFPSNIREIYHRNRGGEVGGILLRPTAPRRFVVASLYARYGTEIAALTSDSSRREYITALKLSCTDIACPRRVTMRLTGDLEYARANPACALTRALMTEIFPRRAFACRRGGGGIGQDYFPQMVLSASDTLDRVLRARCKNKENVL